MHGTKTNRADSVSNPDLQEGVFIGGAFAGGGYVELAPDLAGLGVSHDAQPYFFNPGTTDQTLDFLHAAKTVLRDLGRSWNSNLYITGFSQGGHAAALIQRELELHPDPALQVRAGAGIAGVYDISGAEFPFALSGGKSKYSGYLEDFALSYATHYHESLDSLLRPEYAQSARLLLDGDHNDAFFKQLPPDPRSLFTSEFLAAYDNKQPHWFTTDMQKNDVYAWAPRAPFRAYYGDKDIDATPNNTKFFESEATRKGGDVRAVYCWTGGPHRNCLPCGAADPHVVRRTQHAELTSVIGSAENPGSAARCASADRSPCGTMRRLLWPMNCRS